MKTDCGMSATTLQLAGHVQELLFVCSLTASEKHPVSCRAVKKVQPVLGGFSKDSYKTDRLWATASDGTKVPMSIVYRQGLVKLDGSDPLLLNGSDCILLSL
jgi:prolyl oligopeptidase PreP (S9A serine peptidase family)